MRMFNPQFVSVSSIGHMTTFAAATAAGAGVTFTLEATKHEKWIEFLMQQLVPGTDPPITYMELYSATQKLTQDEQQPPKRKK